MATANEALFDESVRHQVQVRRFATGAALALLAALEKADRALVKVLRDRLAELGGHPDFKSSQWKDLLNEIRVMRKDIITQLRDSTVVKLREFSAVEVEAESSLLIKTIPIEVQLAVTNLKEVWQTTLDKPFAGGFFKDWFKALAEQDQRSIMSAIQMGVAQGETVPDIMRRIAGTKANNFTDGVLAVTRRKAEAIVRTAVNHVSNEAREAVWEDNSDIIAALRWTSVLDGRTTLICASRDGKLAPVGDNPLPPGADPLIPPTARPPAHWNCRSVMTAVIDGEGLLGERPYVQDTRTGRQRQVDFRAEAKATGRPISEIRQQWADEHIGQAPGETTYQDWLTNQPPSFQDEVLGPSRGDLFRSGKLALDAFTDASGRTLTLDELRSLIQ